jgi:hypothetical protein
MFVHNHAQKGLVVLSCGHTYQYSGCRRSWLSLVERYVILNVHFQSLLMLLLIHCSRDFTWIVGFSAKVLSPIKVTLSLPTFVELAFLRGLSYGIEDAVYRSFDRVDLLTHTGVILMKQDAFKPERATMTEFVRSNQDRPWGLDLPKCPTCQVTIFLTASVSDEWCSIKCSRCKSVARRIPRPKFVLPCSMAHLEDGKYFTLPFSSEAVVPVDSACWAVKEFVLK